MKSGIMLELVNENFNFVAAQTLGSLLNNVDFSDVTLVSEDKKQIFAHKAILSARSDVFAALFSHEGTTEDEHGEVNIEDCNQEIMEIFLSNLYGETPPPQDISLEMAKDLMNVANKYNVPCVKDMGQRVIISC